MKKNTIVVILLFFICVFLLVVHNIIQFRHFQEKYSRNIKEEFSKLDSTKQELEKNGFIKLENVLNYSEIEILKNECEKENYKNVKENLLKNPKMTTLIKEITTSDYIFQDYIWIIKKSSVHTCHRDNNGDFFNENQSYPSYTMLVYLEDMDRCIRVLPTSHKRPNIFFNFTENMHDILCKKGDGIIFNANLIHVGTFNEKEDNLRIQLKVTHKNDIPHIMYYEDFNKVLNQDNNLPVSLRKTQSSLSCMFPGISDLTQGENIRTARGSDNAVDVGWFQKTFSYFFYGKSDFYDLPNAF